MATTRSQYQEDVAPTCHVLDFFYDVEGDSALTVSVHDVRFHIIVDADNLKSVTVRTEYMQLLDALKTQNGDNEPSKQAPKKRKRATEDRDEYQDPSDSGYGSSPPAPAHSADESAEQDGDGKAKQDLQNWILAPFNDTFAKRAPASHGQKQKTVHDWFHSTTLFYNMTAEKDGDLQPQEEESTADLEERMSKLIPRLHLPKYILDYNIPSFSSSDLDILETSSNPAPIHPTVVRSKSTGETYFLKLVDPCLLYTSPSPRDGLLSRMPSSA